MKPLPVSKKKDLNIEDSVTDKTRSSKVVPEVSKPAPRSKRTAVMLLSILSIGLLLSTIYLLWLRGQGAVTDSQMAVADTARTVAETDFSKLVSSFTGDTLVLSDSIYTEPIIFTGPINLNRDTLYILSRGNIVMKSDSSFAGPAFFIPATAKAIVFNGLTFDGFNVGIESQSKNVRMEGVKFLNSRAPINYQFRTPADSFLNGTLAEMFFRNDSLAIQRGN